MLGLIRRHPGAVLLAIGVHIAFFALLVVSFRFSETARPVANPQQPQVVQATTVDESKVQAELARLKAEQRRKQQAQEQAKRAAEQAAQQAEQARKREEQRLARLKQQQAAEEARQAKLRQQRLAQQQAEEARLAKLKQQQAALKKQQAEEAKRVAALEAKRKAEEEAQRKAAAEAKRKAEEEAKRKAAEAALQQKLAAEEAKRQAEAEAQRRATLTDQYIARIRSDISQHWLLPPSVRAGITCEIRVQLIPSGEVITVQVVKRSGDPVFDRSVVNAVKRASPLPVPPPDSGIFDTFRSLKLSFRPEDKG